ncbi:MAG: beta strand repeat-containing protein, partial [Mucilaginibacter sp.]
MKAAFTLLQSIVKPFLVAMMMVTCIQSVYAQTTYTWKGTTSSDWNTASNWSPASVPTATSIVQIGYTTFTNSPTISSTETVSAASISFGTAKTATLTLNGNLTVSGDISMASTTTFSMANTGVLTLGGNFSSGTLKFPSSSTAKIIMNGTAAQYFPNTTLLSGAVGYLDVQNTYYNSSSDEGVKLLNNTSGSVTINYLYVENNAIFNANATLVEGSGYHCTIGQHAIYISRSTFNFHSNDVIDPTSTLEFTAANQVINMVKFNADSTNVPPNVLFTGTNITVNAGSSPNNATVFKVLGTLGVINTTNSVTFDSKLTLIDIGDNFTGNGALSSGSLPIHIGGSWLNTATYNVGGVVTYNGNDADSTQIVATSPNYQKDVVFTGATPKTVSSGTMMVGGNLDNSAGTNLNFTTNSSTLLMDGTGTQYIKGGTVTNSTYPNNVVSGTIFNNVTVSTTGTSPNVTLQGYNNIGPQGVLTINSPASLNATATNSLTLMSDATGSATFAALPSGSSITGSTINVQRYIQGSSTGLSKRGYRLLSSPVYTGTVTGSVHVYDLNWLLNSSIVTGASGGGFYSVGNPSVYVFREDIIPSNSLFTSGNYKGISAVNNTPSYNLGSQKRLTVTNINDTTINIPAGNGILFFFRGNKTLSNGTTSGTKTSLPFNYPENVTFTNTGTLNTGTVNVKIWYRQDYNLGYTNSP